MAPITDNFRRAGAAVEAHYRFRAIAMMDGAPFGLAGIWENWQEPASGGSGLLPIITTDAGHSGVTTTVRAGDPAVNPANARPRGAR